MASVVVSLTCGDPGLLNSPDPCKPESEFTSRKMDFSLSRFVDAGMSAAGGRTARRNCPETEQVAHSAYGIRAAATAIAGKGDLPGHRYNNSRKCAQCCNFARRLMCH